MDQGNPPSVQIRQRWIGRFLRLVPRPSAKSLFNLPQHFPRREVAYHHEQRVSGAIVLHVEFLELLQTIARYLRLSRRDRPVRMLPEDHPAQAFPSNEAGGLPFDTHALAPFPSLAF